MLGRITRSAAKKITDNLENTTGKKRESPNVLVEPLKKKKKVADSNVENICPSLLCDHKEDKTGEELTERHIETVQDLINLGNLYHCKNRKSLLGVNLRIICKIIPELEKLNNMIGLENAKSDIVQQILYFAQKNSENEDCGKCIDCKDGGICIKNINCDMLHTIITGPPGVGKTSFGKILCEIYKALGILSKGTFTVAKRSDLIGQYLGLTAIKTQKLIDKSTGGVLFIDEFYSLGSEDGNDSYSKECIDTITLNASENKDIIFFVAGYKKPIYDCVFAQNEGLRRRFAFEYELNPYNSFDLTKILLSLIKVQNLKFDELDIPKLEGFITNKYHFFKNNGGDMETLLLYIKIHMRKRLIFKIDIDKKLIIMEDIKKGFETFLIHRSDFDNTDKNPPPFMYI